MLGGNANVRVVFGPEEPPPPEPIPEVIADPGPPKGTKGFDEQRWVTYLEQHLSDLVWDGLAPLHLALGAIEASVGGDDPRRLYRWKDGDNTFHGRANPVQTGNKTLDQFYRRNRHLGDRLLKVFTVLNTRKPKPLPEPPVSPVRFYQGEDDEGSEEIIMQTNARIEPHPLGNAAQLLIGVGACNVIRVGTPDELQELQRLQGEDEYANLLSPSWVWAVLPTACFRFLLNATTMGGLEMVASELGRIPQFSSVPRDELLYDLISSDEVRDVFCEYVGQRFNKSSGGNLYQTRANGAGKGYMISAGFKTRAININWRRGARIWFERHVYYAPGPTPDERGAQLQQQLDQLHSISLPDAEKRIDKLKRELRDYMGANNLDPAEVRFLNTNYSVPELSDENKRQHPQAAGLHARVITAIRHHMDVVEQMADLQREMVAVALGRECLPKRILRQR